MNIIAWDERSAKRFEIEVETRTADIFDANGLQWTKLTWCNIETGELQRVLQDAIIGKGGSSSSSPLTETIKTAAPLRIVWK